MTIGPSYENPNLASLLLKSQLGTSLFGVPAVQGLLSRKGTIIYFKIQGFLYLQTVSNYEINTIIINSGQMNEMVTRDESLAPSMLCETS